MSGGAAVRRTVEVFPPDNYVEIVFKSGVPANITETAEISSEKGKIHLKYLRFYVEQNIKARVEGTAGNDTLVLIADVEGPAEYTVDAEEEWGDVILDKLTLIATTTADITSDVKARIEMYGGIVR